VERLWDSSLAWRQLRSVRNIGRDTVDARIVLPPLPE
jgi:hypothetical protein